MKIVGAICICVSTAMLGLRFGSAEKTRYRTLCGLITALDFMIAEISCLLTPVKSLLEKLAIQAPEPTRRFFAQCMFRAETQIDIPVTQLWQEIVKEADYLCLRQQEVELLCEIGNVFGRYRSDEQVDLLKGIRGRLETLKETAKEEQSRNVKVYRSLGITCGIAIAILLI